jgi:hypothetical protein
MNKIFNALIFICLICFVSCEGLFPPVKAPAISAKLQADGSYNVTMDAGRNGSIFYTLDGSEPKYPESTLYMQELTNISADTTVRAISYCPSGRYSQIVDVKLVADVTANSVICE